MPGETEREECYNCGKSRPTKQMLEFAEGPVCEQCYYYSEGGEHA